MQWGAVERQPGRYDWSGYQKLFSMVKNTGLRIQAVMSFHACGGNVGDYAQVPLPEWVLKASDIWSDLNDLAWRTVPGFAASQH